MPPESVDVVMLIFVLSAVHPDKMRLVLQNIYKVSGWSLHLKVGRPDLFAPLPLRLLCCLDSVSLLSLGRLGGQCMERGSPA